MYQANISEQVEPDGIELVFIVLNFTTCIPVLLSVGIFRYCDLSEIGEIGNLMFRSLWHFYSMTQNTTTIESWEKDKAATLLRKGKIHEVRFLLNVRQIVAYDNVIQIKFPYVCSQRFLPIALFDLRYRTLAP